MKSLVIKVVLGIGPAIFACGSAISVPTQLEDSVTIVFIPDFISSSAPLDPAMLLKMGCVFSTSEKNELSKVHDALDRSIINAEASAPMINFRQGIIFRKDDLAEEFYFKVRNDDHNPYLVKRIKNNKESGLEIDAISWDKFFKSLDSRKYVLKSSLSGVDCSDFKIFFNRKTKG